MAKGIITIYKGISKTSGKPFTGLMLEAGKFNKLIFLDSALELDYLERYLDKYVKPSDRNVYQDTPVPNEPTPPAPTPEDSQINLNSEDDPSNIWG